MKAAGFTLVELVVTIGILAIMSAVAAPRFFQTSTFQSRGFYDESAAIIRLAQKTAIAWRRQVFVCVSPTTVTAATTAACTGGTELRYPVNNDLAFEPAPPGVTLNTATAAFSFDGLGRPNPNVAVVITFTSTIAGDPARQITIAAETGYVVAN